MASLWPVYDHGKVIQLLMVLLSTMMMDGCEALALGELSNLRNMGEETTDDGLIALASSASPLNAEDECSLDGCVLQDLALLEDYVLNLNRALTNDDMLDEVNNTWCDPEIKVLPFGALASDWSRLLLLQQAQPVDSILRDNLLRLSRLLIVAYFQDNASNETDTSPENAVEGLGDESDERSAMRTPTRPSLEAESPAQQASNVTTLGSTARNESSWISEPSQVRNSSLDDDGGDDASSEEEEDDDDDDDVSTTTPNDNGPSTNSSTSGTDNESIGSSDSIDSTPSTLEDYQTVAPSPRGETIEKLLTSGESNSSNNEAVHDRSKEDFVSSRKNLDSGDLQVAKFFESGDEKVGDDETKQPRDSSEGSQLTASMEELLEIASKQAESGTDSSVESSTEDGLGIADSNLGDSKTTDDSRDAVTSSGLDQSSPDDGLSLLNEVNAMEDAKPQINDTDDDLAKLVDEAANITDDLEVSTSGNDADGFSTLSNDSTMNSSPGKLDSIEKFFSQTGDDVDKTLSLEDDKSSKPKSSPKSLNKLTTKKTTATVPKMDSIEEFFKNSGNSFNDTINLDDDTSASLEEATLSDINLDEVTDKADSSELNDDSNMSASIEELIKELDKVNVTARSNEVANLTKSIEKFFEESGADIDNIKLPTDGPRVDEPVRSSEPLATPGVQKDDLSSTSTSSLTDASSMGESSLAASDANSLNDARSTVKSTDLPDLKVIFNEPSEDSSDSIPDESDDISNLPSLDNLEGLSVEKNDQARLDSGSVDRLLNMGADSSSNGGLPSSNEGSKLSSDDGKNAWWPSLMAQRGTSSQESSIVGNIDSSARAGGNEQEPLLT